MVSGLVTSPWDQDRIFSGLARRILIESKSITTLPSSTFGLIGIIRLIDSPYFPITTVRRAPVLLHWRSGCALRAGRSGAASKGMYDLAPSLGRRARPGRMHRRT